MQSWVFLIGAIAVEVAGTVCLKLSGGFANLKFTVIALSFYAISLWGLSLALRIIPVSTAYAVWSGLGTALVAIIGIYFFKEPVTLMRAIFLVMIITGVIGLNVVGRNAG